MDICEPYKIIKIRAASAVFDEWLLKNASFFSLKRPIVIVTRYPQGI